MQIVYLNGQFITQDKAAISIMDRGFLFGDGIYEVIPIFDGKLFGFKQHMMRFDQSLSAVQIQNPLTHEEWKNVLLQLLVQNQKTTGNYSCYCQVTRGAEETRHHIFPEHLKPTIVSFITSAKTMSNEVIAKGFSAITVDDTRRRDCYIKATSLLPNILYIQEAKKKGAIEAIFIRNNEVLECTSSNIFIVKNKELLTPPLSHSILNGVTRQFILDLAYAHHIPYHETTITSQMLKTADEVWVTGSIKEICPIIKIDDVLINNGHVGPLWKQMVHLYEECKKNA